MSSETLPVPMPHWQQQEIKTKDTSSLCYCLSYFNQPFQHCFNQVKSQHIRSVALCLCRFRMCFDKETVCADCNSSFGYCLNQIRTASRHSVGLIGLLQRMCYIKHYRAIVLFH